jgi:methionyl aminopeptidase
MAGSRRRTRKLSRVSVESPEQLRGLKRAGQVVAETLRVLKDAVAPGVTTAELDRLAGETFARHGARSGPILTYGYPGFVCISVEEEVVHGVPGPRILRAGELVTLDVAAELDGYHADAAITVPVGPVDGRRERLMAATRAALAAGIRAARPNATLREVGAAIEREGWTVRTLDRAPSAHQEHTIMVSATGRPVVLTAA